MAKGEEDIDEDLDDATIYDEGGREDLVNDDAMTAEEEGFMRGYSEDEKIPTCDECGIAVRENKVTKVIDGETHAFCSEDCAQDFEDSMN